MADAPPQPPSARAAKPAKRVLALTVNGAHREVAAPPQALLLDVLREDLGLTGTKRGCDMGTCGCCTVLVDGTPTLACLTLAAQAAGKAITTVEGVGDEGHLHPVQECFATHGGSQCGFCTPGFIMTTHALLQNDPDPSEATIREALSGNLCRCTGYTKIIEAVQAAGQQLRDGRDRAPWLPPPAPIDVRNLPKPSTDVRVKSKHGAPGGGA